MGKVLIGIDKSNSFRVYLGITTDIVEEARKLHNTTPLATAGLGRVLSAASIMGLMLKNESDKLTVHFRGDGPAKEILATANGLGQVKGYISNPNVDMPLREDGHLDVGGSLGIGEVIVTKDLGLKEPYVGRIPLSTGEIAEDLTMYYYISEQQNSSVALGVKVGREGFVLCAGGMIVQMLPGYKEEAVDRLEEVLGKIGSLTTKIEEVMVDSAGKTEEAILDQLQKNIFRDMGEDYQLNVLEYRDVSWNCDCSKERFEAGLMTIGKEELEDILKEDGEAEVVCHFCEKKYKFSEEDIQSIIDKL